MKSGHRIEPMRYDLRGRIPSEDRISGDEALAWDRLSRFARERGYAVERYEGTARSRWLLRVGHPNRSILVPWQDCLLHGRWRDDLGIRINYAFDEDGLVMIGEDS